MTIVVTGGGSGGHITPILAVAKELKELQADVRIVYVGQRGDKLGDVPAQDANIDAVYSVRAGKFRRYHGEGVKQLFDIPTVLKNVRDVLWVLVGCWQSWWLLGRLKPSVIFVKGGFVGVPVGLAAAGRRIPYVTHDSDAIPGLANRLIARWAAVHTVALPKEAYAYPAATTVTVGVPVHADYRPVDAAAKAANKASLQLAPDSQVVLVTGGGLGAQRVNQAMVRLLPELLTDYEKLVVVHTVGRANETAVQAQYQAALTAAQLSRVIIKGYVTDLYRYSGAADVVVARAGATNLAEFAVQGKACVIVPNPLLTGGHQLKNAEFLRNQKAVRVVTESAIQKDVQQLGRVIRELLDDAPARQELAAQLARLAQPDSARKLAMVLLEQASRR